MGGDTCTVTIIGGKTNAGNYTATASGLSNSNYKLPEVKAQAFTIAKADIDSTAITTPAAKTLTYDGTSQELVTAGTAIGGTMQYALGNATAATEHYTTSIPTATDAGTYYIWYKAVGDPNHNDTGTDHVTATIGKAKAAITTLPAAQTLTCNQQPQALVIAGTAGEGGRLVYSTDGANYSEAIPKGTQAGTYEVWFKAQATDDNHFDGDAVKLIVTI